MVESRLEVVGIVGAAGQAFYLFRLDACHRIKILGMDRFDIENLNVHMGFSQVFLEAWIYNLGPLNYSEVMWSLKLVMEAIFLQPSFDAVQCL